MDHISLDESRVSPFINAAEFERYTQAAADASELLKKAEGAGADFLGWVDLPDEYDREEFARIKSAAKRIRKSSDAMIVIGIGGSYLGARAAISFLNTDYGFNDAGFPVYYAGNQLSTSYLNALLDKVRDLDFSVNVISKSGTTTEPAIAFRFFRKLLEEKYGKAGAASRIYATTDRRRGALRELAEREGYETFSVPDDIGGRYSVLTAVGLLPIAAAGADIDSLMEGAASARMEAKYSESRENPALRYAALRNYFSDNGKKIEIMANYEPSLHYFAEWWKQLYGESEGKNGRGLFPAAVDLTTDLHSMGQYIQDGQRILTETVLRFSDDAEPLLIPEAEEDPDRLNYLAGRPLSFVNDAAAEGTIAAHTAGNVPNIVFDIRDRGEKTLGELFYFFEYACGVSGYMQGINPFDQPGVESYKKNMFRLLGRPD